MTAGGRAGEEIALVADTLFIESDRGLASVVWRGRVPLTHAAEDGRVTIAIEGGGEGATETRFGGSAAGPSLPFGPAKSPWAAFPPKGAPKSAALEAPADTGTVLGVRARTAAVLPAEWSPPAPPTTSAPLRPQPDAEPFDLDEVTPPTGLAVAVPLLAPAPVEPAPTPEPSPREDLTLARTASVAASIARRPADRAQILEAAEIPSDAWGDAERRWNEAILDETRRGKRALLDAYDAAYVGRLEEERGPIQIAEYARLVAAGERGTAADALAELGLPRAAAMRIERVWLKKVLGDATFAKAVAKAVKTARSG
jgi:hypothetical protein